ncbi:Polycomb complex protein BMI-1 [Orchesella cincta]|uniref:Polycomb complex protein BMI-1 n=1 Tax=Orchesella cincta TaxID=48709 RepID=A0A1D2NKW5_ORCCI|nr:Polycomb complex protein BMI-1 [Orchesella cincta]
MNATRKVKLKDITSNLTCKLCLGYLVDATTIIECLHSFCKSCIVKYLEKSADLEEKYCPVCDVQLHSTKPFTSIRPDLMLQEIVYKLVPGLFKNEMCRRRKFYEESKEFLPSNQLDSGQVFDELYITSDDIIHLSLEYVTDDVKLKESTKRYLKCPAAVSVSILKKLIQGKYDLELETHIDVMFGDRILPDDFLLMDVAYKYSWTMNGSKPLTLSYRIKGLAKPVIKNETTIKDTPQKQEPVETEQSPGESSVQSKKKVCNENGSNIMPIKSKPAKQQPRNGLPTGEVTVSPIKPPKVRGRKRKLLRYSDVVIESKDDIINLSKRLKTPSSDNSTQSKPALLSPKELIPSKDGSKQVNKDAKEVQLQISENGVISARSVSSGEEKIILNIPSSSTSSNPSPTTSQNVTLAEKLLLSGNFHSKTGPSGVMEIICDKPDPISGSMKSSSAKPGYVTLNIPTPNNPIAQQQNEKSNNRSQNKSNGINSSNSSFSNADGQKSSVQSSPAANLVKVNSKGTSANKSSKANLMQKIRSRISSKGSDGENMKKAISDLGKLCSNGNGTEATKSTELHRTVGVHNLPIITPLHNQFQHQHRAKCSNGVAKNSNESNFALPMGLNFSPASGMSVSMISCTTTAASTASPNNNTPSMSLTLCPTTSISLQVTPPKRVSHQTTVVNGDLKFTTSPKHILPMNGDHDGSPKKPPKFFKSRHAGSPGSSPSTIFKQIAKSPQQQDSEPKRKVASGKGFPENGKKKSKERKDSCSPTPYSPAISPNVANSGQNNCNPALNSTISNSNLMMNGVPRTLNYSSPSDKYAQHLSALNGLGIPDHLSSSIGVAAAVAAAAAQNVNGLSLGMVPFVTDNYCSMPFLNQRIGMSAYPFPYSYPGVGYTNLVGSSTNLISTSSTANLPKSKTTSTNLSFLGGSPKLSNGLSNEASATLDLSIGKSNNGEGAKRKSEEARKSPLLVGLLNSNKDSSNGHNSNSNSSSTGHNGNGQQQGINLDLIRTQTTSGRNDKAELVKLNGTDEANKKNNSPRQSLEKVTEPSVEKSVSNSVEEKGSKITNGGTNNAKQVEASSNKNSCNNEESTLVTGNNSKNTPQKEVNSEKKQSDTPETDCKSVPKSSKVNLTVLDKDKLLCLTAQNNNDQSISNNHDKSEQDSSSPEKLLKSLDSANGKSNGALAVTELSSKSGSA